MASRKDLKKEVQRNTENILEDLCFLSEAANREQLGRIEELINRIILLEAASLTQLSSKAIKRSDSVKEHFARLSETYNTEMENIENTLTQLVEEVLSVAQAS
jgi:hypothetical protein